MSHHRRGIDRQHMGRTVYSSAYVQTLREAGLRVRVTRYGLAIRYSDGTFYWLASPAMPLCEPQPCPTCNTGKPRL